MNNKKEEKMSLLGILIAILVFSSPFIIGFIVMYLAENTPILEIIKYLTYILIALNIIGLFIDIIYYRIQQKKKIKEEKITNLNIEYYREIINNYSPGILSYIHNEKINFRKDFICTYIYLNKKGYLKINEKNFIEITNYSYKNLPWNLVTFINNIELLNDLVNPQKSKNIFKKSWIKSLKEEMKEQGLLKDTKLKLGILGYLLIAEIIISIVLFPFLATEDTNTTITFLLPFASMFLIVASGTPFELYLSDKGYEIKAKLIGLKNFINDFSSINKKQIKEIEILDDYIIYSMLLNFNNDLIKENNDLFNRIYYKRTYQKK